MVTGPVRRMLLLLTTLFLSCGTYHTLRPLNNSRGEYYHSVWIKSNEREATISAYKARNNVYSGTRRDLYQIVNVRGNLVPTGCLKAVYMLDTPLSFAADTVALPYTIPRFIMSKAEEMRFNRDTLPLMKAAALNDSKTVRELLARRVDPNVPDGELNTALHFAVLSGSLEAGRELVHGNARLDIQNKNRWTPLDLAVIYYLNCSACPRAALRELISLMAGRGARSSEAQRIAEEHGDQDILLLLKQKEPGNK